MRKALAFLLAILLMVPLATAASAASTTTLTTTVPEASYTLNIPADQEIPFGATSTYIGKVTVTESSGFAAGKNLNISVAYAPFASEDVATTIPFDLKLSTSNTAPASQMIWREDSTVYFKGLSSGSVSEYPFFNSSSKATCLYVDIDSTDWGLSLAGDYTATLVFTTEVVVETATEG